MIQKEFSLLIDVQLTPEDLALIDRLYAFHLSQLKMQTKRRLVYTDVASFEFGQNQEILIGPPAPKKLNVQIAISDQGVMGYQVSKGIPEQQPFIDKVRAKMAAQEEEYTIFAPAVTKLNKTEPLLVFYGKKANVRLNAARGVWALLA